MAPLWSREVVAYQHRTIRIQTCVRDRFQRVVLVNLSLGLLDQEVFLNSSHADLVMSYWRLIDFWEFGAFLNSFLMACRSRLRKYSASRIRCSLLSSASRRTLVLNHQWGLRIVNEGRNKFDLKGVALHVT